MPTLSASLQVYLEDGQLKVMAADVFGSGASGGTYSTARGLTCGARFPAGVALANATHAAVVLDGSGMAIYVDGRPTFAAAAFSGSGLSVAGLFADPGERKRGGRERGCKRAHFAARALSFL